MNESQQQDKLRTTQRFSSQPTLVKIGVGLTLYNVFVFFEELIIDKHGYSQLLPFYKYAKFCIWDVGAIAAISWFLARGIARRLKREKLPTADHSFSVKASVGLMFINSTVLLAGFLDRYEVLNGSTVWLPVALLILSVIGILCWSIMRPAPRSSLSTQPTLLKFAVGFAIYNSVLFLEYFVVNPFGLGRFLPLYSVDHLTAWDLAVPLLIGLLIWSKGFANQNWLPAFRN